MIGQRERNFIDALSTREKHELAQYINNTMRGIKYDERVRFDCLKRMVEDVFGRRITNTRDALNVWQRAFIGFQMHEEGFAEIAVARLFGMNHASVHNYLNKIDGMLKYPNMYFDVMPYWIEFQKRITA